MSRKSLSIWEQERKREFDKQLKEYSTECLHQIYQIATKGLDMRTRLLANEYLIDKCVGKDYKACSETNQDDEVREININLIVKEGTPVDTEKAEKEIQETLETIDFNADNEAWGEDDFYTP